MEQTIRSFSSRIFGLAGPVLACATFLLWGTAAYAQSRDDQYGSPVDTADRAGRASDVLGVLPDTGGPLLLLAALALLAAGTGAVLVGRTRRPDRADDGPRPGA